MLPEIITRRQAMRFPLLSEYNFNQPNILSSHVLIPVSQGYEARQVPAGYFALVKFMQEDFNAGRAIAVSDLTTRFATDSVHAHRFANLQDRFKSEPCSFLKALRALHNAHILTCALTSTDNDELRPEDVVQRSEAYEALKVRDTYLKHWRRRNRVPIATVG